MPEQHANRAAWVREALERYEAPLLRYAMHITGDLETARDVVQDTFLRLCEAEHDTVGEYLAPWLYRVCRNRALDVMKKERRMQTLAPNDAETRADARPEPRAAAQHSELGTALRAALDALPEAQQEAFRLKFQERLSYKEISEVTGGSINNVRYLIHTSLRNLRNELKGRFDLAAEA
jgi:RNA polymerase sigma factor (sigma-70 family)